MTLRLILMRHAKSGWDDPLLDDHDRPLNDRGRRSATAVGHWLKEMGVKPDAVLCSTSRRTNETWNLVAAQIGPVRAFHDLRSLYLAAPEVMLSAIKTVADAKVAMIIGHNPGTGYLAAALAKTAPVHPQFSRYPTAATTLFEFNCDSWAELGWDQGVVADFIVPRELLAET